MREEYLQQRSSLEKNLAVREEQLLRAQKDIAEIKENYRQQLDEMNARHQKQIDELKATGENLRNEQEQRFAQITEKMSEQLKNTTDEMLKQRQSEFQQSNTQHMSSIVDPLKQKIQEMKDAVDKSRLQQSALEGQLKEQVQSMIRQSDAARQSADCLSQALKGGTKIQGDWGEHYLREILDSIGLVEGRHYETQDTLKDSMGRTIKDDKDHNLRPDVVVHLNEQRDIIIDAKVSLTSYLSYKNETNEALREDLLKKHIESIWKHVLELSKKDYSSYISSQREKMDYVIMFVPNIGALWTALEQKPSLWRDAMAKNVFIADEQTLYAALRIVDMTWKQIAQARNQQEIFRLANEIIDRIGQFHKHFLEMGEKLKAAGKEYEVVSKKLEPGGHSIIQSANKLLKMGAKQSVNNPLPPAEE